MRLATLAASVLLAGCGTATTHPVPTTVPTITLGTQTFALDQLAASPDDGSGTHLLYAVVRVTTTATQYTAHEARFTLVDASGHRYGAVPPSVYVPIDHLDGLMVAPGHAGAGVVAFPATADAPRILLVNDGSVEGMLDAP